MLSVIIIVKDEAAIIGRCLQAVAWADEIIVLDSGSSDDTVNICKKYTDKVFNTDWPGFGPQKQRALDKARGDWVLSIDADEILTPELQREIRQTIETGASEGYLLHRLNYFGDRQIRHGGWRPDHVLRLFRHEKGRFSSDLVHESVIVDGEISKLSGVLHHYTVEDIEEALEKANLYASLGARQLHEDGRRASIYEGAIRGFWAFFRAFVLRAGFLEGAVGYTIALTNAKQSYYKRMKLRDLGRNPDPPQRT